MHLNAEDHVTKRTAITCKDCDFVCEKRFDLKLHISVKHASRLAEFKFSKRHDKNDLLKRVLIFSYIFKCVVATVVVVIDDSEF